MHTTTRLLALAALASAATLAHADFTVYTSQAAFTAATVARGTDTFAGVSLDAASPSPLARSTQSGTAYSYLATASTSTFLGAGSTGDVWLAPNVAGDTVSFTSFSGAITAVGGNFFGSDFNGQYLFGNVTLVVADATGATLTRTITGASVGSFLGFASSGAPIVSLSLTSTPLASGDSLWPTADNLVLAQTAAVPEPATAVLLAFGVAGLAVWRRKG